VIGTAQAQSHSVSRTNPKSTTSNVQNAPSLATSTGKTYEVNAVQSTPIGKNKSKKERGKNKESKNNNQTKQPKNTPVEDRDKHKPRYPFLICGDDHYMKDCPRCAQVTKFLQGTPKPSTPDILVPTLPVSTTGSVGHP
jgi:hypothetical protein